MLSIQLYYMNLSIIFITTLSQIVLVLKNAQIFIPNSQHTSTTTSKNKICLCDSHIFTAKDYAVLFGKGTVDYTPFPLFNLASIPDQGRTPCMKPALEVVLATALFETKI